MKFKTILTTCILALCMTMFGIASIGQAQEISGTYCPRPNDCPDCNCKCECPDECPDLECPNPCGDPCPDVIVRCPACPEIPSTPACPECPDLACPEIPEFPKTIPPGAYTFVGVRNGIFAGETHAWQMDFITVLMGDRAGIAFQYSLNDKDMEGMGIYFLAIPGQ